MEVGETLPVNAVFRSATPDTGTYDATLGRWSVGDVLPAGTATLTVVVTASATVVNGDHIVNAVAVTQENGATPTTPISAQTDTLVGMPDLTIEKSTSQTQVQAGEDITYTIFVTNHGQMAATGVVVTEMLPSNATYKSCSATVGTFDPKTAQWTIDRIAAKGGLAMLTLTLTINSNAPEGQVINRVIITEVDGASNPNGPEASVVTPILNPALRFVKSASSPSGSTLSSSGGMLTYQIQVFNDGHADAHNILITDLVPAACTFVSASCAGAASVSLDAATNTLRCEIAELAAGQNTTVIMKVNVSEWSLIGTRSIRNVAKLSFQDETFDSNTVEHQQTNTASSDVPVTGDRENVWIILAMMASLLILAGTLTWLIMTRSRRQR